MERATSPFTRSLLMFCCAVTCSLANPALAQNFACGNAGYDDGATSEVWYFGGYGAGNPDLMYAVFFDLSDFGYEAGEVEIAGFCAGNEFDIGFGAAWPNEVFIYPDSNGQPDDSVVLAHGTIHTGTGLGYSVVMFDEPVILHGDFWLVNRGHAPFANSDFNMESDAAPDSGHSYRSESGISGLQLTDEGDYILRAYLQPVSRSYLTGGVARASGANDSQWRSKFGILNSSDRMVEAMVTFARAGADPVTMNVTLGPGELRAWDDVVVDLFGITEQVSGSISVDSDYPVVVTARTFNQGDAGTFGQFLPGVSMYQTMGHEEMGVLSQLTNNDAFRTNVGFINLGLDDAKADGDVQIRITVYDGSGSMIGTKNLTAGEGMWKQQNDIFGAVGAGTVDNGYAMVEVMTDGGRVWAYASVVDNATGDPTTIPVHIR